VVGDQAGLGRLGAGQQGLAGFPAHLENDNNE
jgi:hypothetical protein